MKSELLEIYDKNIVHSSFLDDRTVKKCIQESYDLGTQDVLNWLSKMDFLSDNITYIIEEWENQKNYDKRGNNPRNTN